MNDEQELQRMWQESTFPGHADPGELARQIAGKIQKFDRTIFWRNAREYGAGALLFAWFGWLSQYPEQRHITLPGMAAVGFITFYLWKKHRGMPPLDPSADAQSYHRALLDRFDRQIRLLGSVKYWYVLPAYLWMVYVIASVPQSLTARVGRLLIVTVFSAAVVWLNESWGVRKLRRQRDEAQRLVEGSSTDSGDELPPSESRPPSQRSA